MSLASRLKTPGAVMQFLASADGQEIVGYFTELRDKSIKQLRHSSATVEDIRYAQGAADTAEMIVDLKKNITQYLDDVRTGKIKPTQGVVK